MSPSRPRDGSAKSRACSTSQSTASWLPTRACVKKLSRQQRGCSTASALMKSRSISSAPARISREWTSTRYSRTCTSCFTRFPAHNDRTLAKTSRIPPIFGSLNARLKYLLRLYYVNDLAHIKLTAALRAYSWQWGAARERDNTRQLSDHHEMVLALLEEAAAHEEISQGSFRAASSLILSAYTMSLRKAVFEGYAPDKLINYVQPQLEIIMNGLRASSD